MYPDVPAVFVDTGLEYPEIKAFVKTVDNVTILRPLKRVERGVYDVTSFREIIAEEGYPVISKDTSLNIKYGRIAKEKGDMDLYERYVMGKRIDENGNYYSFNPLSKLGKKLLWSNIKVSDDCCTRMKELPLDIYAQETRRKPIIGILAEESDRRKQAWIRTGCNSFNTNRPNSKPLSFWTEQDILRYLHENNIPIANVYGKIVEENNKLRTTGANRTGCIFCMFGAHLEKSPNRFERLKQTHPQLWEYCMKPLDEGGLGLKEVCDFVGIKTGEGDE
jgi:3'-phosphoadenosine 5'-phosphosulfate sulfotransferase (PAPS reductase)/FAD synthetase